jgi:thiamine biosynthesis lipoprotein
VRRAHRSNGAHGAPYWLLWLAILLTACTPPLHKQQSYVFGTLVEVTVYGEDEARAQQATDAVLHEFDRMHRTFHAWEPGLLEDLNAAITKASPAHPARVEVSPELAAMLSDATRLAGLGDNLFNPAIGNLIRLWGFHTDTFEPHLPDPQAVARLVAARPQLSDLRISGNQVETGNAAVRIDLGGYAKGYALDRAAAILKAQGVHNALVNIGGNILALGQKGGKPWKVGIQHPRRAGALATLALRDGEAIGTSGDYQRFFEVAGKRYCHLIDPRTGQPADQAQAVTVIAHGPHAGTLSDVASKPLFIAGPTDWPRMAAKMGIDEVLFVAADGSLAATRAMQARATWENPAPAVRVVP